MIHLTLATGHSRVSPRAEVRDDVIAALRPLVRARRGTLPGPPGYSYRATHTGRNVAYTISRALEGGGHAPLVTCLLARESPAQVWSVARRDSIFSPGLEMPDALPWLAVIIHPTLQHEPAAIAWLGDLERCIAWTIIEDQPS